MGRYKYRALNGENKKIQGSHEAKSKEEVVNFIVGNGMYPLMVEEIVQSKDINFGNNRRVKVKDIAVFCRQFYTMLNAGVPILECLSILSGQIENNKLRRTMMQVEGEVNKGGVLSESMKKHSKVFPSMFTSLVASGEASGKLDSVLMRMSDYYEKETKVSNKVKRAMIYPCVLAVVAVVAVSFILVYVMPTFVDLFDDPSELPWSTRFLLGLSGFVQAHGLAILLVIAGITIGLVYYFKTEKGKVTASKLQLKIPFIRKLNEMTIVSQFTRTMSTLISSGIPLIESLNIATDVVKNKVAKDALRKVNEQVSRGESLYYSIEETGVFPTMLCAMVKIGEETGDLDDILNKTADFYDEELDSTIQSTVALMEPLLIVVMGIVVGFMVISIMLPMFDSYSRI